MFYMHQPTGLGMPGQFHLAGSDWVLDKTGPIKISIHGLMGEIEVNGVKYNNVTCLRRVLPRFPYR